MLLLLTTFVSASLIFAVSELITNHEQNAISSAGAVVSNKQCPMGDEMLITRMMIKKWKERKMRE